jgi:hypothetical protein
MIKTTNNFLNYWIGGVSETVVPPGDCWFGHKKGMMSNGCVGEGRKPTLTLAVQEHPLRCLILNQEKMGVKFQKGMIVNSKTINRYKILGGLWNMQDIFKK